MNDVRPIVVETVSRFKHIVEKDVYDGLKLGNEGEAIITSLPLRTGVNVVSAVEQRTRNFQEVTVRSLIEIIETAPRKMA